MITKEYLRDNPDHIFVFGDNLLRYGKGGAAILRDEPNTYGFITKKAPNNKDSSFYKPSEYIMVFKEEMNKLIEKIVDNPEKIFLISPIGSGLANKYGIFESIIQTELILLKHLFPNVRLI